MLCIATQIDNSAFVDGLVSAEDVSVSVDRIPVDTDEGEWGGGCLGEVFRHVWVQVWLKITLPIDDDNMTVRLEDDARKLLKTLEDTSTGAIEANEQLQAGWQRLWDLGALRKFEQI